MRVLGFGTYDLTKHPRVGIILDGLRGHGDDVVEINAPMGFSTAERVAMLGRPWLVYRLVLRILVRWLSLTRRTRTARRRGSFDAVVVGYLGHFDVLLARLLFPRTRIVLDLLIFAADTARDRGVRGGLKLRLLDALDHLAVSCADIVVVDTDEHISLLPASVRGKAVVVPVGAPRDWFRDRSDHLPESDVLRVVFFGLYTPLQGATTIGTALAALADRRDVAVTMIGTGQDYEQTRALAAANTMVSWLEWVDSQDLPQLVADHDVCLGIFGTTPKALRVVPNKVYQGAAAGCALITSDTPPQRRALENAAILVPPGDAVKLASEIASLADDPALLARLRAASRRNADERFTPSEIVKPLRIRLGASSDRDTRQEGHALAPVPPLAIRAWLRYDVVSRVFDRLNPATVLEVGCGQGAFGARIAGRVSYLGVEPDKSSFDVAASRIKAQGGAVLNGIHDVVPAGSTFDAVCAFEVLEHIDDDVAALASWVPLIKPGGHLVMSVPAFQERFGPMDTHAGHFRRYSPDLLRARLTEAGLVLEDIIVYGWPLGYALEAVRNRIDAKKLATARAANVPIEELTAASGRTFQPSKPFTGAVVKAATVPFRYLQRAQPKRGTGLVAVARRPAA